MFPDNDGFDEGNQPGDEKLFVQFYDGSYQDSALSEQEGRPVFTTRPFVKILVPGDRTTVINTLADATYQRRFPRQWKAYQEKSSQDIQGTLLSEVPVVTRAQAQELEYFKIFTVEQLAGANDNLSTKIPGFQQLKQKAAVYVESAKDAALAQKLTAENTALRGRVESLESEIARLSQMFDAMKAPQVEVSRVEQQRSRNRPSGV